ncbi:class I SAM-dependent methyltransferase [Nonlabens xylanidelens]|uniref:class I SAM-dependent methyltransferase n=1 Tax=Nonlabens xylanidelens TaxID=191564 RepID=UPI001B809BCA|nr:class I SAM-dependent methyltransferase [Nonlabens xylanidelens]
MDVFLRPQKRRLFEEINLLDHGKLLEIGVGNGTHLGLYKKHALIGIDTSKSMLSKAIDYATQEMQLLHMSGEQLEFEDHCFDYIVLSHVIAVVEHPEKMLEECCRVLKKDGSLILLNHFTPNNFLGYIDRAFQLFSPIFHFKSAFYLKDLKALKKIELKEQIHFSRLRYFKLLIYKKP